MNIRTRTNPVDSLRTYMRAYYWRWRAKAADEDAEMLRATAFRSKFEAEACEVAAREWRAKAWRIERGLE